MSDVPDQVPIPAPASSNEFPIQADSPTAATVRRVASVGNDRLLEYTHLVLFSSTDRAKLKRKIPRRLILREC